MSDINIQTFSGKVQVNNNLKVGSGHLLVDTANNQVGLNTTNPLANLHVNGNTYVHSDLRVGSGIVMDQKVATFGATKTFVVEVVGGVFQIDGVSRPALTFHENQTYIFDQSHVSNSGHPIAFSEAVNGGTPYSTGVTSVGTPGQAGAKTTFKVSVGAPSNLFYYCVNHPSTMGSLAGTPSVVSTEAEIIVSGRLLATSIHGDGSALVNIPSSAINGTLSQWTDVNTNEIYYDLGNVGIGNQNPNSTLDVTGTGAFSTTLTVGGDLTVGTDKFFVDVSTGQVGVGTTNPAAGKALDVIGDLRATYLYGDGSNINNITSSQWVTTGNDIYYDTGSVRVGSNQPPAYTLDVLGDINFTGDIRKGGVVQTFGGGAAGGGTWTEISGTTQIHYSTGNVGIANTNPQHTLSVGSNLYVEDAGSNVLVIDGNVACNQVTLGQFEIVPSYGLNDVTAESNVTTDTVELNNVTTGLSTVSNVAVGGELAVTGNVVVSKDLTVTRNVSDLNILSNVNMLHTANTAAIKLNSNVVTEFPRSKKLTKYPRVAMTSDNQPTGYVASASTSNTGGSGTQYNPWKAFNNTYESDNQSGWASASSTFSSQVPSGTAASFNGDSGEHLTIQLPNKIKLETYHLFGRQDIRTDEFPVSAKLYASNDNFTNFELIESYEDLAQPSSSTEAQVHNINETRYFQYYRLMVTKTSGTQNYAAVGEWELFGVPEYDSGAHGTDITVKSVSNVPNTDWLQVYYDGQDYAADTDFTAPNGVLDKAGADNHGSQTGNVGFDTEYKAFTFDGSTTQHIRGTMPSTVVHTIGCWFKMLDTGTTHMIFAAGNAQSRETTGFFSDNTGKLRVFFFNNDFILPTITANKWYHICYSYSGGVLSHSTVKTYLNGTEITGTRSVSNAGVLNLTNFNFSINGDNDGAYIGEPLHVANLRIFNRVLSSDEVYQLYAYQMKDFGHGDISMTLKAGRLGIGTSEPTGNIDVRSGNGNRMVFSNDLKLYRDDYWFQVPSYPSSASDLRATLGNNPIDGLYFLKMPHNPYPEQFYVYFDKQFASEGVHNYIVLSNFGPFTANYDEYGYFSTGNWDNHGNINTRRDSLYSRLLLLDIERYPDAFPVINGKYYIWLQNRLETSGNPKINWVSAQTVSPYEPKSGDVNVAGKVEIYTEASGFLEFGGYYNRLASGETSGGTISGATPIGAWYHNAGTLSFWGNGIPVSRGAATYNGIALNTQSAESIHNIFAVAN